MVLGPQPISCVYQALCLIGEGGEMVADEAGGDVMFGGFQEDTPETGLSTSTGGGRRFSAKLQLRLLEVGGEEQLNVETVTWWAGGCGWDINPLQKAFGKKSYAPKT